MDKSNQSSPSQQDVKTSAQSAFKALELLNFHLCQRVKPAARVLLDHVHGLDNESKLQLSHLCKSLESSEKLLQETLKQEDSNHVFGIDSKVFDDKLQVEKAMLALATTSSKDYESFLQYCVKTLAEFYQCRYAFIGLLNRDKTCVTTQVVWNGDGYSENFEYPLAGSVCEDIINFTKEYIPRRAADRYPHDELVVAMGIESFYGIPIVHKEIGVIGLVAVMDSEPMPVNEWVAPLLSVFAARLSSEIQIYQNLQLLKQLNASLEQRIRKRSEELEATHQDLREFSAAVSHDLRAPIRNINAYLDIVFSQLEHELSPSLLEWMTRIRGNAINMDRLISDLLTLSGVNKNQLLVKKLDLNAIIADELIYLHESAPTRAIYLDIQDGMSCWGDEGLIRLLWQILLANAWKFTAKVEKPRIAIQQNLEKDRVVYSIRDNGAGFEMEKSDLLFKPFKRLHAPSEFPGNGVGLATAEKIIKRHKGAIWASSQALQGATFYFYLGASKPIGRTK